ncbi:MAG: hypothetical protein LBP32_05515 [Spirochaetaceae bacterium]|jgi:hypothetical protein|nr:hypothetical protein [Spirochaetaceae bacterium]
MAADFLELAKKVREVLATRREGDDIKSLVSAAAYVVLNPSERNEIVRKETLAGMMRDIEKSGYFKPEKLSHMEKIIPKVGGYHNDPFSYNDCLSVEEKKALRLNPEHKVSREMVECMSEKGLAEANPRHIVPIIYFMNYFTVSRKYKLIELRARGVITVRITSLGGDLDCEAIEKIERVYPINEVPVLPLPGCTAPYCRCDYVAHDG